MLMNDILIIIVYVSHPSVGIAALWASADIQD